MMWKKLASNSGNQTCIGVKFLTSNGFKKCLHNFFPSCYPNFKLRVSDFVKACGMGFLSNQRTQSQIWGGDLNKNPRHLPCVSKLMNLGQVIWWYERFATNCIFEHLSPFHLKICWKKRVRFLDFSKNISSSFQSNYIVYDAEGCILGEVVGLLKKSFRYFSNCSTRALSHKTFWDFLWYFMISGKHWNMDFHNYLIYRSSLTLAGKHLALVHWFKKKN